MNLGRCVFAQIVELLPRRAFDSAVARYNGHYRVRHFSCMDQLLCMLFAQFTAAASLREAVNCLRALDFRLYHCGIRARIARSTLADANESRDFRIFRDLALALIAKAQRLLPRDVQFQHLQTRVYALDATLIDLCLHLFPWALYKRRVGAVKAHVLYDITAGIPVFMHVSHGKRGDSFVLDLIVPQPGAFYVMDKGYIDFERLYRLHTAGAFFVTRAKKKLDYRTQRRLPVPPDGPVRFDRLIRLRGPLTRKKYRDTLRLIGYVAPDTGRRLVFLTNNLTLEPHTIALLYKHRWQIELFFKWIKQHLHIQAFFGTSANAVQTQLWIAVIAYVLVALVKQQHQLPQNPFEILQIFRVTLMQKGPLNEVFSTIQKSNDEYENANQLSLFEI